MMPAVKNMARKNIDRLQAAMSQFPQVELETSHFFANGMYARVVKRLADTTIVGKVHKHEHFYIVTKGRVLVTGGDGPPKEYQAGDVVVSQPGTKRAVYALEDSICMTVHRTEKIALDEIEQELVEHDEHSLFGVDNKLKALK